MSEVTYYVALQFVFSDDGIAAGEAAECLSANAAVMRAEALSRNRVMPAPSPSRGPATRQAGPSATLG